MSNSIRIYLSFLLILVGVNALATEYHFDSKSGNNNNSGTSVESAFKSLDKISALHLKPGDKILLKRGETFTGTIALKNVQGLKSKPILISSYGKASAKPHIDAKGELNGILLENCSHINVDDIEITADGGGVENYKEGGKYMRCGVFITTSKAGDFPGITIENLYVHDVFFEQPGFDRGSAEVLTGNGNQNYGWGIRVINSRKDAVLKDILVSNCHIENVAHSGIRFTGNHGLSTDNFKNIQNVKVLNNLVERAGGPAMQASVVENVTFAYNTTLRSGSPDDSRKWGRGSGLWVWGCLNALIEHNNFRKANGPAGSAGCHIDFNNKNVVIQYNLSEGNAGGFVEILGNNHNCTYRYNVSINDGSRKWITDKTLGAGTMIGINGFIGFNKPRVGPFNIYLYNNTIYVKEGMTPEVGFAKTLEGVFIANNIFYLEDHAVHDHRKSFLKENGPIKSVVFENNLYLKANNWPNIDSVMISDNAPVYGDPEFVNKGGLEIQDYLPQNTALIKDKGINIYNIPTDTIGLTVGFEVDRDILGNKIKRMPDMGAIEVK